MPSEASPAYNLGLTAASLRPELARIVAEHYLETGSWDAAKERILSANALQARTQESARRLERELRGRLTTLSEEQITLLARSTGEDRVAMAWLAVIKHSVFAFEFAAEVLRSKLEEHDPVLRPSDYEGYVEEKMVVHPELTRLTASTKGKIRRLLLYMLVEAGLTGPGTDLRPIHRPVLSGSTVQVIAADDPAWLASFLVPDHEIARLREASP